MQPFQLNERQGSLLTALLVLGIVVLASAAIWIVATAFFAFGDTILIFFLAWLLAFILSPLVTRLTNAIPFLPRVVATILVYAALAGAIILVVVVLAGALASSIAEFIDERPETARAAAAAARDVADGAPGLRPPGRPRRPGR